MNLDFRRIFSIELNWVPWCLRILKLHILLTTIMILMTNLRDHSRTEIHLNTSSKSILSNVYTSMLMSSKNKYLLELKSMQLLKYSIRNLPGQTCSLVVAWVKRQLAGFKNRNYIFMMDRPLLARDIKLLENICINDKMIN